MTERFIKGVAAPAYPHRAEPTEGYKPSPYDADFIDVVPPVVLAPPQAHQNEANSSLPAMLEGEIIPENKTVKSNERSYPLGLVLGSAAVVVTLIGGGIAQTVVSGLRENGAAERLPALAQADGFAGAERAGDVPEGDLTTFVPTINVKVNDVCTLSGVRFVALDSSGKISWGGDITNIDSYTIVSEPVSRTSRLVETFHNMQDFTAQGLAKKYCA